MAIAGNLAYPRISDNGIVYYDELMSFLKKCAAYSNGKSMSLKRLERKAKNGDHAMLKWYEVVLVQWILATGLSNIMNKAIQYKVDHPRSSITFCSFLKSKRISPSGEFPQ